jgi:hypothetical protein
LDQTAVVGQRGQADAGGDELVAGGDCGEAAERIEVVRGLVDAAGAPRAEVAGQVEAAHGRGAVAGEAGGGDLVGDGDVFERDVHCVDAAALGDLEGERGIGELALF